MSFETYAAIISALVAVGSLFVSWRRLGPERRKILAEAEKVAAERDQVNIAALDNIIEILREHKAEIEAELEKVRGELKKVRAALALSEDKRKALERKFEILCLWLRGQGFDPDRIIEEGLGG